jgi:hypothetical protein
MQWVKNRLLTFVGIALIGFAASAPIAVLSVNPAFAQDPPAQSQATEERSCAVEKVGWLVCPIIEHISSLGDFAFSILSNMFLETEPELVANNSGTFDAWSIARDLANILFAIAFLIIVLSQITGFGLTNYGIKRMLPRLIVAAIAVNASYWICQALVDLSNIGGWVIKDFLSDIASQVSNKSAMAVNIQGTDFQTSNGTLGRAGVLATIAIGVLALAGSVLFFLPILGSVVTMVFLTCLSVIIILLLRKAIIVLLVVISPIAFVLYLLPNTERLFNRWLKMFIQLLMVFPVVSLLFGGGQLASAVVLAAGSNGDVGIYESGTGKCISLPSSRPEASTTSQTALGNCGRNGTPIILGIIAAGIAVAPLIAVWPVLQGALAATGSIGGKISSLSQMPRNAYRKRFAENREYLGNLQARRALQGGGIPGTRRRIRKREERRAMQESAKAQYHEARTEYIAKETSKNDGNNRLARQLAGGSGPGGIIGASEQDRLKVVANAQYALGQLADQAIKSYQGEVGKQDIDTLYTELIGKDASSFKDDAKTAAMLLRVFEAGTEDQKAALIDAFGNTAGLASKTMAAALQANNPGYYGAGDIDDIARGNAEAGRGRTAKDMVREKIISGGWAPLKMATASGPAIDFAKKLAVEDSSQGDMRVIHQLTTTAKEVIANDQYRGQLGGTRQTVENWATMGSSGGSNIPGAPGGPGAGSPPPTGPNSSPPPGMMGPSGGTP